MTSDEQLVSALGLLRLEPPRALRGRVFEAVLPSDEFVRAESPLGSVFVSFGARGITSVTLAALVHDDEEEFTRQFRAEQGRRLQRAAAPPAGLAAALRTGDGRRLAYDLSSLGPFARAVLEATLEIPRGEVRPYSWVAERIGRPRAVRAVGTALARNPIPLLIPCHRVVRVDGRIGEYGLGTDRKRAILTHEAVDLDALAEAARRGARVVGVTSTAIYCLPGCRSLARSSASRRIGFRSATEAEKAGYRACERCRPRPAATSS